MMGQTRERRPTNIDMGSLFAYQFPLPAVTSILHRISGLIVFLMIPLLLWILDQSLSSLDSFEQLQECMSGFVAKFILWGTLSALFYHLIAGVKHLIMDMGIGEDLSGARVGAWIVLVLSIFTALLLGAWLW